MTKKLVDCPECDGQGWYVGTGTGSDHGCDGTEEDCIRTCPVPVPIPIQVECPNCYRGQVEVDE